jgi:hypothetical protein
MKSNAIIFLIITALVIAGGAYWYESTHTGNESPVTADGEKKENDPQVQFNALVSQLSTVSFNSDATKIFSDPRFTGLVDLATSVTPEDSGRPDPFAPIPGISVIK